MAPLPPLARSFSIADLAAFDDEGLATFLHPARGGVDATCLGRALRGSEHDALAGRLLRVISPRAAAGVQAARAGEVDGADVEAARAELLERLFWPLVYWLRPELYEELVSGEDLDPGLVASIDLDGRVVADLGAGAGRFTRLAAARARRVVAVDAVPALLDRLRTRAAADGLRNIEVRRGGFAHLPLRRGEVDVAVACSSLSSRPPLGGEAALREALRVVRPGGELWVIWPDDPLYFTARGFHFLQSPPAPARTFASVDAAVRLCRAFYGERVAAWIAEHATTTVPYRLLGMRPPADACVIRVSPTRHGEDDLLVDRPRPGVELG